MFGSGLSGFRASGSVKFQSNRDNTCRSSSQKLITKVQRSEYFASVCPYSLCLIMMS